MKQLFFLIATLFIGINATAQIGITRNGKIHLEYTEVFSDRLGYLNTAFIFNEFYNNLHEWQSIAKYKPKTKKITIKKKFVEYDAFYEKWVKRIEGDISSYTITISYNRFGDVDSIITKAYDEFLEKYINYHKIRYYYDNKYRIERIRTGKDNGWDEGLDFKYNDNGELTKARDIWSDQIYLFEWTSEGLLYKISEYEKDGSIKPIVGVNWEGHHVQSFYNYNTGKYGSQFLYDSTGFLTHADFTEFENHFSENISNKKPDEITVSDGALKCDRHYGTDGNLIKEFYYTVKNGQRIYREGYFYEYTYVFYK